MGWVPRRLSVTAAMVAFSLFGDSMLYAVLPSQAVELGISAAAVGWLLSANRWVRLLTNPFAARLASRLGWRAPFLGALVVGGLTTIGYGVLHQVWALLIARALWGLCWSFLRHGGYEAVLEVSGPDTRGRFMGFLTGIFRLGSLVGMLAGGLLTDVIGYRPTLVLFGISTFVGLGVAAWDGWLSRSALRGEGRVGNVDAAPATGVAPPVVRRPSAMLTALRKPAWLGVTLSGLLVQAITSGLVTSTLGRLLQDRFATGWQLGTMAVGVATLTGTLLSIRWVTGILLSPMMGYASDRIGRHVLVIGGATLAAAGLLGLAYAPGLLVVALGVLTLWLAESCMGPALDARAADLAQHQGAEAMGLYANGVDLGAALGPIVGYTLLDQGVALPLVYKLGAGALLVMAVLTWTVQRKGEQVYEAAG